MKALTLQEPWASLIVAGAKTIETRSWQTHYRGRIAIHAGKSLSMIGGRENLNHLLLTEPSWGRAGLCQDLGAVIGEVTLVDVTPTEHWMTSREKWDEIPEDELNFGNFDRGRFAWLLEDPMRYDEPIPWSGGLSLWELPIEPAVRA